MSDLEATIKKMFRHLSNEALVKRINQAPDFGWDDEEYELDRRVKASEGRFIVKMNYNTLEIIKNE